VLRTLAILKSFEIRPIGLLSHNFAAHKVMSLLGNFGHRQTKKEAGSSLLCVVDNSTRSYKLIPLIHAFTDLHI
jgi:hypothetical protein